MNEIKTTPQHKLNIETNRFKAPSGREYIQFQPVLIPDCCATGQLRFAVWQSWADEPSTHEPAKLAALASARAVIAEFVGAVNGGIQ